MTVLLRICYITFQGRTGSNLRRHSRGAPFLMIMSHLERHSRNGIALLKLFLEEFRCRLRHPMLSRILCEGTCQLMLHLVHLTLSFLPNPLAMLIPTRRALSIRGPLSLPKIRCSTSIMTVFSPLLLMLLQRSLHLSYDPTVCR